jgi:hypothetical protein
MAVIGSVIWEPQSPSVGESVKIDVCGPTGQPYANQQPEYVAIDGVAGSQQYVQFVWPGEQQVFVTAIASDGTPEQSTISITVAAPQPPATLLAVPAGSAQSQPQASAEAQLEAAMNAQILTVAPQSQGETTYAATFALRPVSALVTPPPLVEPGSPVTQTPGKPTLTTTPVTTAVRRADGAIAVVHGQIAAPDPGPLDRYEWDFGDGSPTVKTITPEVDHDFETALGTEREFQQFHVTVTDLKTAGTPSYTRTLSVMNAYVTCKKRGYVIPSVTAEGWARKVGTNFVGTAVIQNHEPVAFELVSRQLIPILDDPTVLTVPSSLEPLDPPITVPADGSASVQVIAPFSAVPENALGYSAVFTEQRVDSLPFGVLQGPSVIQFDEVTGGGASKPAVQSVASAGRQAVTTAAMPEASARATGPAPELDPIAVREPIPVPEPVSVAEPGPVREPVPVPDPIAGLKIRATAHFQVQPQDRLSNGLRVGSIGVASLVAEPALLEQVIGQSPLGLQATDAGRLETLGLETPVRPLVSPIVEHDVPSGAPADPAPQGSPVAPGNVCDPDNPPANVPSDLVCQMTQQTEVVPTPAQFLNARKGDVVLAPGGNGLIGGLLTQVNPPQKYSHSGIMSLNHQQITHCTASQQRLQAYPTGGNWLGGENQPLGGFQPNAVKYGWPGVLTQTVDHAIGTEVFTDPDSGTQYTLGPSFNAVPTGATIAGQFTIIPPLVVKPDPLLETTAVRSLLGKVANDADAQTGQAHYRFYCYTKPAIGEDPAEVAPPGTGWAAGTFPAVCSAFIWLMMKRNGVEAEGPSVIVTTSELGPQAAAEGVQVSSDTPDGLFYYPQAQRESAGQWLYQSLYNMAYSQTGWLGEDLTKAAEHIGNQLCNAFANDDCSAENDSTAWQTPGDANAVSPDNLMAWNGPDRGGVLGYIEPLIFCGPRLDTINVYKWAKAGSRGTLSGHVYFNGQPVERVTLQLSSFYAFSQADGSYAFDNVPYGAYELKAQLASEVGSGTQQTTQYLATQQPVNIESPAATQDVTLQLPDADYRQVVVEGSMQLNCTKKGWFIKLSSENATVPFVQYLDVGPYGTHAAQSSHGSVDSAYADLDVTVDWQIDNSVVVGFNGILDGSAASWGNTFTLGPGASQGWTINLSGNDDSAVIQVSFANNVQPA